MAELFVRLMGSFAVHRSPEPIPVDRWDYRRAAELTKLLALQRGRRMARDVVLETIWPHLDPEAAASNLHKTASMARKALGDKDALVLRSGYVELAPHDEVVVDVEVFEQAVESALESGTPEAAQIALGAYGGEVLPEDPYTDWLRDTRTRVRSRWLQMLQQAERWEELVAAEPTREDAHRELMRHAAQRGDRHAVLRHFEALRAVLASELGVEPAPETIQLLTDLGQSLDAHVLSAAERPFIGRDVERIRLRAVLRDVSPRRGATVVLDGEAGIGKTRLVEEILTEASAAGWVCVRGWVEGPVQRWGPVPRALLDLLDRRPDLATLAPAAHDVLRSVENDDRPTQLSRQQVLGAVVEVLERASRPRGVALFLDDCHDGSASFFDLVQAISARTQFASVLLLCAYRGAAPAAALSHSRVQHVAVGPLDRREAIRLADLVAAEPLDADAQAEIWRLAAGHPFYTEELARTGLAGDRTVPARLQAVVDQQVSSVGDDGVEVLRWAALLGAAFSVHELQAVVGDDAAESAIDDALARRLLVPWEDRLRFRHGLVHAALLDSWSPTRRPKAHLRIAESLVELGAPGERIALHFRAAGSDERALPWLLDAVSKAFDRAAWATARELLDTCTEIAPEDPHVLAALARVKFLMGDGDVPLAFGKAIERASEPERSDLRVEQAYALLVAGDVPAARAALDGVAPHGDAARVRYLVTQAYASWFCGEVDAANDAALEAQTTAVRAGLGRELYDATLARSAIAHSTGNWADLFVTDLTQTGMSASVASLVHDAHLCAVQPYLYGGKPLEEIVDFASSLRRTARMSGAQRGYAFATLLLGEAELLAENFDDAEGWLREATRLSLEVGALASVAVGLHRQAELALELGRREESIRLVNESLRYAEASPLSARHLLQRGWGHWVAIAPTVEEALSHVRESQERVVGAAEQCPACSVHFTVPAADALARAGATQEAGEYLDAARTSERVFWNSPYWRAQIRGVEGEIARAREDWDAMDGAFAEAADILEGLGHARAASRWRDR